VAKHTQHVAPNNVAPKNVAPNNVAMLRWHVAIVWPELYEHIEILAVLT